MGVEGIPESSPIDDGLHGGQQPWSRPGDRSRDDLPRQLLEGQDRVELTPPLAGALGVVHASLLGAIQDRLGVEPPPFLRAEYATEPGERADQLAAEAAALLHAAQRAGVPDAVARFTEGAELGAEQALEVLDRLGHLDGEAGEAVAALLAAWSERLARLAGG